MDILIEEKDGGLWVACLQGGVLEGLEIDPPDEPVRWGSIYRGRVKTIDKTMDAAFVDLDDHHTGLLYNKDIRIAGPDNTVIAGGGKAIGQILTPGDMVTVQVKNTHGAPSSVQNPAPTITKTARVSMDITLQGRYLIFCPHMRENRISSRITDKKLRTQLKEMLDAMEDGLAGFILRSAAANMQTDILSREARVLTHIWESISLFTDAAQPDLIMLGPNAVQRSLSDQATRQIDVINITTMDHLERAEEWCQVFAPDLLTKIVPVQLDDAVEDLALFHARDIVQKIDRLLQPYVILPGGGNIIIQETAALTAVDVNKAGSKQSNLALNTEAAETLARHMRLRNTGGIVTVDFLRMQGEKNEKKFLKALKQYVAQDPCTVQIHGKTPTGLWELTRTRRTPPLADRLRGSP